MNLEPRRAALKVRQAAFAARQTPGVATKAAAMAPAVATKPGSNWVPLALGALVLTVVFWPRK